MTDPIILTIVAFFAALAVMLFGLPVGISLGLIGCLGYFVLLGNPGLSPMVPFTTLNSFVLTAVPLFILMGEILVQSGASDKIYKGVYTFVGSLKGGLLHANIVACALFAAVSGSSPATAATIGTVAIPELKRRNYETNITLGSLAAGGTLGILIPPSLNMIIYGMLANVSIGKLFAAGVIPGIILAIMFMIYIAIMVAFKPSIAPKERVQITTKSIGVALLDLWPLYFLGIVVLGGIFSGVMTPTEAAAIGSVAALLIAVVMRKMKFKLLRSCLVKALEVTCMVLIIVTCASILSSFFSRAGVPAIVSQWVANSGLSKWIILSLIYLIYIILGCFIDPASIIVLSAATVVPLIKVMGFDLVWFGILYVITAEMGMITPPMGINLFVIQGISRQPISKVILGSLPFFCVMVVAMIVFTVFPNLVLWLPSMMKF